MGLAGGTEGGRGGRGGGLVGAIGVTGVCGDRVVNRLLVEQKEQAGERVTRADLEMMRDRLNVSWHI